MMKQCVFLFVFSLGVHGIRLQPSRQGLQQALDIEPKSVMDDIMPAKGPYVSGQTINTCYLPWGETTEQFVAGANWYSDSILDNSVITAQNIDPVITDLTSSITDVTVAFKEKTSRSKDIEACDDYVSNLRATTNTPMYSQLGTAAKDSLAPANSKYFEFSCAITDWYNQTHVRGMIYDWKHNNYGGNFRIPSWMYLCAGMTANGDPHVVNILGETFDIVSQGEVELVRYPEGADDSSSKLIITASIDKLGKGCHDTYMKKIAVSGAWLKEAISFKDDEDSGNVLVLQGSDARPAPVEFNKMNGSDAVKLDSKQIHFSSPKRVSLTVAGVTQVVVYTAGRPHKGVGTYLNLDLQGFTNLEGKVGGLLGQDSHKKELDLAKEVCRKSSVAKSRALHQKGNDVPLYEEDRLFHVEMH